MSRRRGRESEEAQVKAEPMAHPNKRARRSASPLDIIPVATQETQYPKGAGKGNRVMGAQLRGKSRAAIQAADDKAEAELSMATTVYTPHPTTEDEVLLAEHASHPRVNPAEVKLPLEVGTIVDTLWRDDKHYAARVIERRKLESGTGYQYYVHFLRFNRRMDDWVNLDAMDLTTVELPETVLDAAGKGKVLRRHRDEEHDDEDHSMFDANQLKEHEEFTKVKNVELIELGRYEMETWYFSPLPEEFRDCKKLYFSEFDLNFFREKDLMVAHLRKCKLQFPPGDEIYRNGNISMFEVDGKKEQAYCQNLAYLAKLFLDHKSLWSDVEIFLFYVLCEVDERGAHIVGYFSKEKQSDEGCNLACILALPPYQRKGYGKFLISMSYELSKIEQKVGTPERPLSDLGKASYRGYWTRQILKVLMEHTGTISVKDLSLKTAIKPEDIRTTLEEHLNLVQMYKGQKAICADPVIIKRHLEQAGNPGLVVDPSRIVWTPYILEKDVANYRT